MTGGLFSHEIKLSDEKQEGNRGREAVREPRVRKKHRRRMKNAFQMLLTMGGVRPEIKIIWFYDPRSRHQDRDGHWATSNNGRDK